MGGWDTDVFLGKSFNWGNGSSSLTELGTIPWPRLGLPMSQVPRSMRPSPWLCPCSVWSPPPPPPTPAALKEKFQSRKRKKLGYYRGKRICVRSWSFFYIEINWHLLATIRIPPLTPQRMLQIPSPPPSPHACAYSPAYLVCVSCQCYFACALSPLGDHIL